MHLIGNQPLEEIGKNFERFRFAVLYHKLSDSCERPSHWDLLLEQPSSQGNSLLTFEVSVPPLEWGDPILVRKLPDHRPVYLNYEGPVSEDRGYVTRVLEGFFRWQTIDGNSLRLALLSSKSPVETDSKGRLQGLLSLQKHGTKGLWELQLRTS